MQITEEEYHALRDMDGIPFNVMHKDGQYHLVDTRGNRMAMEAVEQMRHAAVHCK